MSEVSLNKLWSVYSKDGDSIALGVYNQRPGFTVFSKSNAGKGPIFKYTFSDECVRKLIRVLSKMMVTPGEQREAIIQTEWDQNTKQSNKVGQLTFIKDDKDMYSIEVKNKHMGAPMVFTMKAPASFNTSGDGLSMAERSELTLDAFIQKLKDINHACWMSPRIVPQKGNNRFGDNSGGGGDSRPASSEDTTMFD